MWSQTQPQEKIDNVTSSVLVTNKDNIGGLRDINQFEHIGEVWDVILPRQELENIVVAMTLHYWHWVEKYPQSSSDPTSDCPFWPELDMDWSVAKLEGYIASVRWIHAILKDFSLRERCWGDYPGYLSDNPVRRMFTKKEFEIMWRHWRVEFIDSEEKESAEEEKQDEVIEEQPKRQHHSSAFMERASERVVEVWRAGTFISVDDSMLRTTGRIKGKIRVQNKPGGNREGIPYLTMTDSSTHRCGMVLGSAAPMDGKVYLEAKLDSWGNTKTKTEAVITTLISKLPAGHKICLDNGLTSVNLCEMAWTNGLGIFGTFNGKMGCQPAFTKEEQAFYFGSMTRGDIVRWYLKSGTAPICLTWWKDARDVKFIDNFFTATETGRNVRSVTRWVKDKNRTNGGRKKAIQVVMPLIAQLYNDHKSGTDTSNAGLSYLGYFQKNRRKDVAVLNGQFCQHIVLTTINLWRENRLSKGFDLPSLRDVWDLFVAILEQRWRGQKARHPEWIHSEGNYDSSRQKNRPQPVGAHIPCSEGWTKPCVVCGQRTVNRCGTCTIPSAKPLAVCHPIKRQGILKKQCWFLVMGHLEGNSYQRASRDHVKIAGTRVKCHFCGKKCKQMYRCEGTTCAESTPVFRWCKSCWEEFHRI